MNRAILIAIATLLTLGTRVGLAETKLSPNGEYLLSDFGDVTKADGLQALVNQACEQIKTMGGGVLVVPPNAPRTVVLQNLSQTERKSGPDGVPLVTILDRRHGQHFLVPPIGQWSTQGWNGMDIRRTMNFQGPGASSWGGFNVLNIANQVIHGSSSHHNPASSAASKGKNSRIYVDNIRGLFVGQYLNYYGTDGGGGFEGITVRSLGWDAEKNLPYITADLEKDHVKGGYLSNKNVVGGLQIDSTHNADNQTMEFQVTRRQYAHGDSFLISGTYIYQGDGITQGGDEGGIIYNAEPSQDPNPFYSTVESVDWSKDALVFAAGVCNVEKLASSRPIINMNPKKWITTGTVQIVPPDNWSGFYVVHPKQSPDDVIKSGVDLKGWEYMRKRSAGEKLYPMLHDTGPVYTELFDNKTEVPTVLTWDGQPVEKFKYVYKGRAYPSIIAHYVNELGGRIIASADCGWTEAVVGRYFAIADDSECLCPNDKDYVSCYPTGNPQRKVYRWYPITKFYKNSDGTCSIRLGRVRFRPTNAGAPNLYKQDNYTWDGHERPLTYIIASGAMVYDVGEAWQDAYGGVANPKGARMLRLAPAPHRGTDVDFAKGDPIEQAIGADPNHPIAFRTRLWHNVPDNFEEGHGTIAISNDGTVAAGAAVSIGGCLYSEEIAKRKDRRPPFVSLFELRSSAETGFRFAGEMTDAALRFNQPRGRPQPIKWNHAKGESTLIVDPKSGDLKFNGGDLDVAGVKGAQGVSGTEVGANNLRGIDVAVPKGAKEVTVQFEKPEKDAKYSITVEPSWATPHGVTEKTAESFKVVFAEAARANARLDWQLIR